MNKYPLNLSPTYCDDWSVQDAIREIIQNCLDDKSTFQYHMEGDELHLTSLGVQLPLKTLLLGNSTKANDSSAVGGFGEGYKIALLVLLREGYEVIIQNGSKLWNPVFEYCDQYDSDMLYIYEDDIFGNDDLTFIIKGLCEEDLEEVQNRCLYLKEDLGEVLEGSTGRIILGTSGKLYVGGLYVSDTNLHYSYDFNPDVLKLNRDRKAVNSWDLEYETSRLWNNVSTPETVADMVHRQCPDVRLVTCTKTPSLPSSCYNTYVEKYGEVPIAADTWEKDDMEAQGYKDVVVTGNTEFTKLVKESPEYQGLDFEMDETEDESPMDLLDKLNDYMHEEASYEVYKEFEETYDKLASRGIKWDE